MNATADESSTEIALPGQTLRLQVAKHGTIDIEGRWRRQVARRCIVLMRDHRCPLHARQVLLQQLVRCHTGTVEDIDEFDKQLYRIWPEFWLVWSDPAGRAAVHAPIVARGASWRS